MSNPDDTIDDHYREQMNDLAEFLDGVFNHPGQPKRVAFVLLMTEFDNMEGRVNYISNGKRADTIVMLKEVTARFEGQPEQKGRA
jgi:hypothetical protein